MSQTTTVEQRQAFYEAYQAGQSYREIAEAQGVSRAVVRKWCRRQRDNKAIQTIYYRRPPGILSEFEPIVRYVILRLRLQHPRWGPQRIYEHLRRRPSLQGLVLPSRASIGRYLHQWVRFRRKLTSRSTKHVPPRAKQVHECWQLDFKMGIALTNGNQVNLHSVRDPIGEVCITALITPAGLVGQAPAHVCLADVQKTLRTGFLRWRTLPKIIQTDNEALFVRQTDDPLPSLFTLWLVGLGIDHQRIQPGCPTQNGAVERSHRTLYEYAIVGNEHLNELQLQQVIDQAIEDLAFHFPSQAQGCLGQPPVVAHPQLLQPLRPFQAEQELLLFDLNRVYAYLAGFTWRRKVQKNGQICIGGSKLRYSVGKAYAGQMVQILFDPADQHFVFYPDTPQPPDPNTQIRRKPAKHLQMDNLISLITHTSGPQQLPLPFPGFPPQVHFR